MKVLALIAVDVMEWEGKRVCKWQTWGGGIGQREGEGVGRKKRKQSNERAMW